MGNISLRIKLIVLLVGAVAVICFFNSIWAIDLQNSHAENELLEKGRALAGEMDAFWSFMSINQDKLQEMAYDENGAYRGIHCAIAGTVTGKIFSETSGYTIRFVNFNPRNPTNKPDGYETEALYALTSKQTTEYYGFSEMDGEKVFRYLAPMTMQESCLICHGQPAGEMDMTGHAKEGWDIGDVGGAISITMPTDLHKAAWEDDLRRNIAFYVILAVAMIGIIYIALNYLVVRPLKRIEQGIRSINGSGFSVALPPGQTSAEMNSIVRHLSETARELNDLHRDLESKVQSRTESLHRLNELLEKSKRDLEIANQRLAEENQYKTDFLSMTSHELRTPLTSIMAFVTLLRKSCTDAHPREIEMINEIESNARTLLLLVSNILEMSRVETGRATFEPELLDVGDVAQSVYATIRPLAREKGLAFSYDIAPDVPLIVADYEKLRRMMENLLSNAVKFTQEGGSVGMEISYDRTNDQLTIRVHDNGCGIAPDKQELIFDIFTQVDASSSRRYNGSGLGLSLVREYATMHGGSVEVESEPDRGSVFSVILPANSAQTKEDSQ